MFLKSLMQGEKFAFYSIAKYLVSIDGEYSAEEQKSRKPMSRESGP